MPLLRNCTHARMHAVSSIATSQMKKRHSIKQLLSDSLRVVEGSKADPPLATGAAVSVGYTTQGSTHGGCA
ncbi:unnamed protein product [Brassica oleracea var. botrytis]|uniref:(rape) hypothetical protein n=1 Tax=Brassica napus TaxID=3708 RepID=A0A816M5A2_BRANA|nr:unnamed protein product [Brassica napus]